MPDYFVQAKVLEIGSLNINGTVRDYFADCQYLGLDIGPGRDVDLVCEGQRYDGPADSFDHIISCEAMEHNPQWSATFSNMIRLCKPDGLITLTCATTGRAEHGTIRSLPANSPLTVGQGWDYYRNLRPRDFRHAFDLQKEFSLHHFWVNWQSFDLYFIGIKRAPVMSSNLGRKWVRAVAEISDYVTASNKPRKCAYRAVIAPLAGDRWFAFMRDIALKLNQLHS